MPEAVRRRMKDKKNEPEKNMTQIFLVLRLKNNSRNNYQSENWLSVQIRSVKWEVTTSVDGTKNSNNNNIINNNNNNNYYYYYYYYYC